MLGLGLSYCHQVGKTILFDRKNERTVSTEFFSTGRYEEALVSYSQAVLSTPGDAIAYVGMGDCLRKLKRFEEALHAFEEALAIDPKCIKAHIGKCYSYLKLGRVDAAFTAYRKAIKLDPHSAGAYNAKGQILQSQQKYEMALRAFERAIELARDTDNIAGFYYNKGLTLVDLRSFDDALSAYEQARQHNPENPKYRDAVKSLSKNARNMNGRGYANGDESTYQSKTFAIQGHAFFRLGKSGQALIAYDNAIALRTQDAQCYKNLASILVQFHHFEEAAFRFTQALRLNPQDASTRMEMGYLFIKLERYDDALQMFKTSLQLDSHLAPGYVGKGHALFALHHDIEALKAYADAIDLHTSDPTCYINSGDILNGLHFYEGAVQGFLQAIQYAPQSVSAYTGLGKALLATEQYTDAFVAYVQAYSLDTTNIAVYQNVLDSIAVICERDDAFSIFEASFEKLWEKLNAQEIWSLLSLFSSVHAVGSIQFTLLQHFIVHAPWDEQMNEALGKIGNLWDDLFESSKLASNTISYHVEMLHTLLLHLSEAQYADALTLITTSDEYRIAQLLIHLAPYSLPSLSPLAHQITLRLAPTRRSDRLIYRFCDVLDAYDVPDEDIDWLFARQLMVDEMYLQARSILFQLVKTHATPDSLWMLGIAMEHCDNPAHEQIDILHQFIASAVPFDVLLGDAWKRIGNLWWEMREGLAAIEAFEQAALCGCIAPQLEVYRSGEWAAIPGFEQHPNFLFPPVVVIDVESDYAPDAEDGSRIFQIAAVRMKGRTELEHRDLIIKRDFVSPKFAYRQNEAIEPEEAACVLQRFISTSIVVGHNIEAFDAKHLRGMGVTIDSAQIMDTLTIARLLYPDSVHHSLGLLCHEHHIPFEGDQHTALPDARACASLLVSLGDEVVCRGERLLAGFRAFVPRGSAFDRAVLQPRGVPADPAIHWKLDPSPAPLCILALPAEGSASPHIVEALEQGIDALVERYDPTGAYMQHLPSQRRAVVIVDSRNRLEQMLALAQDILDLFVLPDPQTLLCPDRLQHCIEHEQRWVVQLELFCLYQASHNHDARTLYPLRLPFEEFAELRQVLLSACCASQWRHPETCRGSVIAQGASEEHSVLFATHEALLHRSHDPEADLIIVDDIGALQMHFAEYFAERISSEQVRVRSPEVFSLLEERITSYVRHSMSSPGLFERLPLRSIAPLLVQPLNGSDESSLSKLKTSGQIGEEIAGVLEMFCQLDTQEATNPETVHACWLELRTVPPKEDVDWQIEQWSFCGLSQNLRQAFRERLWQPYRQHILCGTAVELGASGKTFLTRYFGLPEDIPFFADQRPATQMYIPPRHVIHPASYLGRRKWARSIGEFLYHLAQTEYRSLIVSLQAGPVAQALVQALSEVRDLTDRQVLSPQSGWTTAKIAERLADPERKTIAFVSPRLRESVLGGAVDIEATGPLRFLNQQDPLVAAHMQLFSRLYQSENPFSSYLLLQALLELKTRLSSPARIHIILDSGLQEKVYRSEVETLLGQDSVLKPLPGMPDELKAGSRVFTGVLEDALERCGLVARTSVSDEMLYQALRTFWQTDGFREAPLDQKEVVQAVLDGKDRLVIAATGGGKSLCYQLPAILMAQDSLPKVTLVVSPLVALMGDQVEALKKKGIFSAIVWNSTLSGPERRNYLEGIRRGWYSIIYIAPEQIHSSALRKALDTREIGLIAVDEAHCVSQWGHSFRTSYSGLKHWIETQLCNGGERYFPLIALTATARDGYKDPKTGVVERGTVQDIILNLGLREHEGTIALTPPERPELDFSVMPIPLSCLQCQTELGVKAGTVTCPTCGQSRAIQKEDVEEAKRQRLVEMLVDASEQGLRLKWDRPYGQRQRGIIYCTYTATVDQLAGILRADPRLAGLRILAYHGQKSHQVLSDAYNAFTCDDEHGIDIVVATNAFGMGIDVRRLGFVIHFDTPGTLEAYIQEAGRAGRDHEFQQSSERARCILLYHEYDLRKQRFLNEKSRIAEIDIIAVYEALRKYRKNGAQEVYISVDDLGQLAGIKKTEDNDGRDKNKVQAIIYYLEHHTCANRKPLLERREDVQTRWLLAWEHGYQDCIQHAALSDPSQQLINAFLTSTEFRLCERKVRLVDGDELAERLQWDKERLQEAIGILLRKRILVQDTHLFIRWLRNKGEARELITKLEQDIISILKSVQDQPTLQNGKRVVIDVETFAHEHKFSAECLSIFLLLFAVLSKSSAAGLRLFEYFERHISGLYELQLIAKDQFRPTRQRIFEQLRHNIQQYSPGSPTNDWQVQDMLAEIPDPRERYRVGECLRVLKELRVLVLESPRENTNAMRIVFEQEDVPSDLLTIDLFRLRLIERYTERKLERMKTYAETKSTEQRRSLIADYFSGTTPLLEPFAMRGDLTPQQQMIVALPEGYHLIKGPAGSGKTTILEERLRYLVEHELVPRDHILVVTHYHSGVDRISNTVNKDRGRDKAVHAVTLNGLGESIFRTHHQHLLRPDGQPYYADTEKLNILSDKGREIGDTERQLLREVLANMRQQKLFPDLSHPSRAEECRKAIERLRQNGIFPSHPIDDEIRHLLDNSSRSGRASFVYDVYGRYLVLLGERGWYAYDDQILFALAILRTNLDIARSYQRLYEHILIDEFQDLTAAELQLIGMLSRQYCNVMAFGDDAQDIRVKNEQKSTAPPVVKATWSVSEGGIVGDLDDFPFDDHPF